MSAVVAPKTSKVIGWQDSIPFRYEYFPGVAGEAFLSALRTGKIVASKCLSCGDLRLPPRSYCVICYGRTRMDVEIYQLGRLQATTSVRAGPGRDRTTFGFIVFQEVSGGLVHRVGNKRGPQLSKGELVRAVFRPQGERVGSILDIECFTSTKRK